MKKFILLTLIIFLCGSCFEKKQELKLTLSPTIVIETHQGDITPYSGGAITIYEIKTFNGSDVNWYSVSATDFKKISVGDTLTNYVIYLNM